jgi:vitamin B12 transporter
MLSIALFAAAAGSPALEPVVVTATRTEVPVSDVLESVEILTGDALAMRPAADLGDALRFVPGVEVTRLGGAGQQTSIFVRGTESNHVLVLVDGLRINPGTTGTAAIQNVAPEFVDRVEVVKGPLSTLYGTDAIGGVINIITRAPGPGGSVQAGGGSYGTSSASFSAGFGDEESGVTLGGAWLESTGFPTQPADDVDRGTDNLSFTASARTTVGAAMVGARAWYASGTTDFSQFGTPLDQDFENSAFAAFAGFAPSEDWNSRLTAGYATDEIDQNQLGAFDFNGIKDFAHTRRTSLDWQNDVTLSPDASLTAGLLWQDEDVDAESFDQPYDADTTTGQAYVQGRMTLGRQQLQLAAAYLDHETFGGHATWNAAWGIGIGDGGVLTLAAGTGFRAPDATDLYGFGRNPDLDPEESTSFEVGYRQSLGERQSVSVTAFRNDIDDLIEFFVTDPDTFEGENRNVDSARIDGLEAAWHYADDDWSASVAATWQDPRDRVTDERLLRRARENYTAAVARRFGAHEIGLDVLYAGERRDFGFPAQTVLDPYTLVNLSARVALGDRFTLLLRAENLFDEDYELASGYDSMGQSFFGALRYEFR